MNVLDLFSGIGGFSLGLERAGMRTVAFCERDEYCRAVLAKHWPKVPCFDDIHTIDARGLDRLGSIDLVCGGFPCQPFSVAGKQKGKEDDRHLWPEMLRVIALARPAWVIGENVAGLIAMALDDVLADLEGLGYTARTFVIPACAVGAPHRRDRLWIVANASSERRQQVAGGAHGNESENEGRPTNETDESASSGEDVADTEAMQRRAIKWNESDGTLQRAEDVGNATCELFAVRRPGTEQTRWRESTDAGWWSVEPDVGRVATRISFGLDDCRGRLDEYAGALARAKGITTDAAYIGCLRALREYGELAEASSQLPGRSNFRDPLSSVSREVARRRKVGISYEAMRDLWDQVSTEPLEEAHDVLKGVLVRAWKTQCNETLGKRVARLRCLGNAVVPQIPEIIGRAIMRVSKQ